MGREHDRAMPTKEKLVELARRRSRRILIGLGEELLAARHQHGLSQSDVGRVAGVSRSQVSRIERGLSPMLSIDLASRLLGSVGLELSARAYPGGEPLRDSAQLGLLSRFERLLAKDQVLKHEVPLPGFGEQRAWDLVLEVSEGWVVAEAETRPREVQALLRRLASKKRDDPRASAVILILADTRYNRRLVNEHARVLGADLPYSGDAILTSLRDRRLPPADGILLV
jgi:transcriptional regulator with XRE-family HTH domain